MKAMVLRAPGEIALEERERPSAGGEEALIRVTHSGVCGTDLKTFHGEIPVRHPLIMGHELTGQLVDGGGDRVQRGTRVIVDPALFCGTCFHCQASQTNLCPHGVLLGRDRDGGFAEYIAVPRRNVYPLPDAIPPYAAPLIQVLTTCLHAQRLVRLFPGDSVVVLGLGVSGQLHIQLAKARGACPVIGITRSGWKRELAARLGADITLSTDEMMPDRVFDATHGRGADLVIETVGKTSTLAEAINLSRGGGQVLAYGITAEDQGALPLYQLYFKELSVFGARAAKGEDFPAAIDLVLRGEVLLAPLITQVLPLDKLDGALDALASGRSHTMKLILEHA